MHGLGQEGLLPAWLGFQLAAMMAAFAWWVRRTRDIPKARICLLIGFVGAAIGAVMLAPMLALPGWLMRGGASPWQGRVMSYGALGGLSLALYACARRRGIAAAVALDRLAPTLGLIVLVARAGCFFAGCDFGTPSTLPWAVSYAPFSPAWIHHVDRGWIDSAANASLSLHPAQLYESLVGALMIAAALWCEKRRRPGEAFAAAAACYALGRFAVEMFRGDPGRGQLGPLSSPQWLSLAVLAAAILFWPRRTVRTE